MARVGGPSASAAQRLCAPTGEVGLLAEEGVQRLLAIFSEFAMSCLRQIHRMSQQHGDVKCAALYRVGLDLVQRWDPEVTQEETTRIEATYPETQALHSYACLWLMDNLCSDEDLSRALPAPTLSSTFALFMKRMAIHEDVKQGFTFMEAPELHRRAVFVDAFRGAYHDALQQSSVLQKQQAASHGFALGTRRREPLVSPNEAASQAGAPPHSARSNASRQSALRDAVVHSAFGTGAVTGPDAVGGPGAVLHLPRGEALSSETATGPLFSICSQGTKAVTVKGPCFFSNPEATASVA